MQGNLSKKVSEKITKIDLNLLQKKSRFSHLKSS